MIKASNKKTLLKSGRLDQFGISASVACAIHCAALPFLITLLPLWGLGFLANPWVEFSMIGLSLLIGTWSLARSYPRHKRIIPVLVLITGFMLIGTGHYGFHFLEAILIPLGGFTIALAHLINWKYARNCTHD
ncbi:MerC domain-containing protein [Pedobacter sp. PLR]|uniref:MerC domain-containing protein n=1 Tax=Pedobacter sp. PLR TaxID=2994465 RepID=UPI0022480174|nr:MerC domain-containing protein [Pedobacter sp. PLR]MCX2451940.1 MerC domain-containing protein [Pedobacter sp. PLR]